VRYYDTSAVFKLYVIEQGSSGVRRLMELDEAPITSTATAAEVPAALAMGVRAGRFGADKAQAALESFRHEWADYARFPLSGTLADEAGQLAWRLGLRGYDAVHLATAQEAGRLYGESPVMVTFDRRLYQAARSLGLETYPEDLDTYLSG
jgi:uncharacterized protein